MEENMKFISKYLALTVRTPSTGKLMRFKNGQYATTDPEEIAILKNAKGVKCLGGAEAPAPAVSVTEDAQDSPKRGPGRPKR
jgi:hypothetical protein